MELLVDGFLKEKRGVLGMVMMEWHCVNYFTFTCGWLLALSERRVDWAV